MATNPWGSSNLNPAVISSATGPQTSPAVADSGGTEFGVAWIDGNTITVSFFDEQGLPNAALPSATVTDGVGANLTDLQMIAGGTGIGYGVVWAETDTGASQLHLRYYNGVTATLLGGEIAISSSDPTLPGALNQHDVSISSFTHDDAGGRPNVDGFDVAWVESAGGSHELGNVYVQRFAVPLDASKDPTSPPVAAGMDGKPATGDDAQVLVSASGRDPSVAGLLGAANETIVTWIDGSNNINIGIFNDDGTVNTNPLGVATNNLNTALAPLGAASQQHLIALAGGGFAVVWMAASGDNNFLAARVFTPGAAAGTFTASPVQVLDPLDGASNGIQDFTLAALPDTGGFTATWTALDDPDGAGPLAAAQAIYTRSYSAGGVPQELAPAVFHAPADAAAAAATGLIGDRFVVVYEDNSVPGDASNIGAQIFDTRLDAVGNPIVLNGPGVTLTGDPEFETRGRIDPDVLVGTIGQDLIDGRQADDILDGGLGDDRIIAGQGNDSIDGGGGNDTLVLTGRYTQDGDDTNDDYIIAFEGNNIFTILDKRANADGSDLVRNVENFEFSTGTVTAAQLSGEGPAITPTAWGWTNADADNAPDAAGTPDVDGFLVNHAPASSAGVQTNPFLADSVGEFFGVVWENASAAGADTHIRGQFYDVIGAFDAFLPNAIDISDGIGIETNPVIVSGGANSGWGVAWEQIDNMSDSSHEIRTNFVGPGQLTSVELSVFNEGPGVDQHDAAMSGSFLDRTLDSPVGGSVLPTGMSDGYNVVWVSTDIGGSLPADYGRIMLQRFEVPLDPLGNPGAPISGGVDGIAGLDGHTVSSANDGPVQLALAGRNPSTAALHTFETGVVWIEQDGTGGEKVVFRAYDDIGQVIDFAAGDNISVGFPVAAGTSAHIVSAGAVNFGIAWITADATSPSGYSIMGTMLSSAGNGLDGQGFGFGAPVAPFQLTQLPAGFDPAAADFHLTGISGEDSSDLIVSWNQVGADGADVMAQHIRVTLDPVTGIVLSMTPEGSTVTVNAETVGTQDDASIAGLLGDRFIAVYHDDNATYTDGNDIVGRIIDTRDAVNPDPIIGDLVRPDGTIQARRDVLIGTNGNDDIRGDISSSDGLVDYIFAGMGDDVIQGGPGLRGAAGIPEIIDGGAGNDTSVYTGRLRDYSITINGDGSFEVIDLRPVQNGSPHDGIDNLFNIENLQFLDLANGGAEAQTISFGFPGTPPAPPADYDGTPVAWSLGDTSQFKEIAVDHGTGTQSGIAVTNLQDGAGLAWVSGTGNEVWAIAYDTTGRPDPILLGANTQLTDGSFSGNTVADIDVAMTGGLGMTAVWESENAGDTSIHLRFASTNTHVVLDPAAGVPGPGLPGGEIVVVGSDGDGVAVDPVIQGYEIVNLDNDTLEVGFHIGYVAMDAVNDTSPGDAYGALTLARYEIPVYDILVDAAGLPVLDANGQGQLATDAFGNLMPSTAATFGTGSETAPVSTGLDGLRGTADDLAAIVLTNAGLLAANDPLVGSDADHTAIQGRDISIGSLHDGQLVVSYIGTDEQVRLKVFIPSVNQTGDRETRGNIDPGTGLPTDVVATGVTSYSEFTLPFATTLGAVAPGQTAYVVPQQNGSFGVFWAAAGAAGLDINGIIYMGAGTNWSPSPVITFASGLPADAAFQVAPTGVTPGGLEDGFFVSWQSGAGILGQRFDMTGALVGEQITVGDPTTGTPGLHSTAGIDDGRMLIGYEDGGDVSAQYLDNREPGVPLIGPRTGAPRDVIVGTVGDDAIDGRALEDQLYGGLGNDLITMGADADIGFGGLGNDTIIGGGGQDQLLGEDGDDLLWGGLSGPIDPQVDRDLQAGLVAAGIDPALIATDPGADIVSGGAGIDTISFQGEFGAFNIDLSTGIVTSDRDNDGSFILEDVIGQVVDDGAGGTIFTFILDVENATGGIKDDVLIGTAGDNVLDGGAGSNIIDGGAGNDTVIINGNFADFLLSFDPSTNTFTIVNATDPTQANTATNVEIFRFADGDKTIADLALGPAAQDDTITVAEDTSVTFDVRANDLFPAPVTVTAINGTQITAGGPAVDVLHGSVALGTDGQLTFTPAADYFGPAGFSYEITDGDGRFSTADVSITVTNVNDAPTDIVINGNPALNTVSVPENAPTGTVVATLSTVDPDNANGVISDAFSYTLQDNLGGRFQIVGDQVQVLDGALLDFEGVNTFNLDVTVSDGHAGSTLTETVAVNLTNVNEAPTNIALSNATFVETAANGFVIGTFSGLDPEGQAIAYSLADDANGRFSIVKNGAGWQLTVAENLLIDHRLNPNGDADHAYTIQVRAMDASGASSLQTLTVTATGVAENRITGTAADNTLTGTAGADFIDGGAGKDTMTGGAGNDAYIIDNGGDKAIEAGNGGIDTIYTTLASFDLKSQSNVENLVFIGTGDFTLTNFTGKGGNLSSTLISSSGNDNLQGGNGDDRLEGRAGNDSLQGGNGNDTLIGGLGSDTLNGGNGNDTFVFAAGFGSDVIQSFGDASGNQDVIDFASSVFADFAALQAAMAQSGNNVVISDGFGDALTIQGVTLASLGADDFHFF
jgi:Ca2+-binding RTX toxin-like protein